MNVAEAQDCVERLWEEHCEKVRADTERRTGIEENRISFGEITTPYMNDSQWEHMGVCYREGVKKE